MGKRYYCDYCDKSMVDSPSMVKTHIKGLAHQKIVQEHYAQFKDPETILAEENGKRPCTRFLRGECSFGAVCHFSHYTREQLDAMRQYVSTKNKDNQSQINPSHSLEDLYQKLQDEKLNKPQESNGQTIVCDKNGVTHVLPWTYNVALDSYGENLPPSIRRMNVEDFEAADAALSHAVTSSAEGPPDSLIKNVIRIIGFHERLLKNHSDFDLNNIDIAKMADANEKLGLIRILHRTTKGKNALRSAKEEMSSKKPIIPIIHIGAIPKERRSGCFGDLPKKPKKVRVDSAAEIKKKIAELTDFMSKHYESTMYFYSEMLRIQRYREIYDDLRKMVRYLEHPGREYMKKAALQCYKTEVIQKQRTTNFWGNRTPNNLNVNILRDPINDGLLGP